MKLAIMQPYFFPYIGYFQLVNAVDKFVNYDDVTYIKKGWINRNYIQSQGERLLFSIPIKDISSFRLINETEINERLYSQWKKKFIKTLHYNYLNAPYYRETVNLVEDVLNHPSNQISTLAYKSIVATSNYVNIKTQFVDSSTIYNNENLKGKERVLDICKQENASVYINLIGGQSLYDKNEFKSFGIDMFFIESRNIRYRQQKSEFIPNLSILDVMMFNSPEKIKELLTEYNLI